MTANALTTARKCVSTLVLTFGLLAPSASPASPVLFSTSGEFDLPTGTLPLAGVTDATPAAYVSIGTLPIVFSPPLEGDTPFHLQFQFSNGLPPISVSGTIHAINYNADMPVKNPLVATSATSAQFDLYPTLFQDLIQHPDWLHSTSFTLTQPKPPMDISISVHPEDPNEIRVVPEPSSVMIFAMIVGGLGWRTCSHRRAAGRSLIRHD